MIAAPADSLTSRAKPLVRAWPAAVAAVMSVLIGLVTPLVSPLIIALLLGAVIANSPLADSTVLVRSSSGAKTLLRWGVVLLGTRLSLEGLEVVGVRGLVVIAVTVAAVFALTVAIGDRLGLDRGLVSLIASGFSICGAAAIAAVESGIRRRDEDVGIALALVTICGTVMIPLVPAVGAAIGMTPEQIGIWAGASIHEVAQVIAAASLAGGSAVVAVATTIKLGRVALLAVAFGAARWRDRRATQPGGGSMTLTSPRVPLLPWFVIGFVLAAAARSAGVLPARILPMLDDGATLLLAAGMFGLGLGISARNLFPMPWRIVVLAAASTLMAAVIPLGLILWLW